MFRPKIAEKLFKPYHDSGKEGKFEKYRVEFYVTWYMSYDVS